MRGCGVLRYGLLGAEVIVLTAKCSEKSRDAAMTVPPLLLPFLVFPPGCLQLGAWAGIVFFVAQ